MVSPSNPGLSSISKKFLLFPSALVCLALVFSSALFAQSDEWKRLNQQALVLYKQGDYKRATEVAQSALELAERELRPEHPEVARSLNNLAELYRAQGEYAEAEPLHRRALTIWEKTLGPDHQRGETVAWSRRVCLLRLAVERQYGFGYSIRRVVGAASRCVAVMVVFGVP